MRAPGWVVCVFAVAIAAPAAAEPKPTKVDISAYKAELTLYQDSAGGIYAVQIGGAGQESRVFYGTAKALYEQVYTGRSKDGDAWSISVWAPRVPEVRPGQIVRDKTGAVYKWCDGRDDHQLTQLTGEKAKAIFEKTPFMTTALIRRPHLLARDDAGTYYYVDIIRKQYGGNGHRVFVGKKGAMKQVPLTDVASDTGGDVFATKTGDLRLVRDQGEPRPKITWVKGEKRRDLVMLDVDANSRLIFRDLGIYNFLGTICDNI